MYPRQTNEGDIRLTQDGAIRVISGFVLDINGKRTISIDSALTRILHIYDNPQQKIVVISP